MEQRNANATQCKELTCPLTGLQCNRESCAWFDGMKKACCVKGLAELRQTLHVVRDDE